MDMRAAANGSMLCQPHTNGRTRGVFFGDDPFDSAFPLLLTQMSLSALVTGVLQFLLSPLGETAFVSQMLTGMLMGPSFIGRSSLFRKTVFPRRSFYVSETFAFFGCMLFLFLVGVKTDLSILPQSGKKAVVIGLGTFFIPLGLSTTAAFILRSNISMGSNLHDSLVFVAAFQSLSSFHVIACLLSDLKLLNSELGRLALSCSMVSGLCSYAWAIIAFTAKQGILGQQGSVLWMILCYGCMLILVIYIFRPVMFWMIKQTAGRKSIREGFIVAIFIMILACSFFGEVVGQHFLFGPMILGMAVPESPPLGSSLVDKLDSYVSSILLPLYFVISGARIDLSTIHMKTLGIVEVLACFSFMGKLMGTMLPALYCKMPLGDALSLGLIMSSQGITDMQYLKRGMQLKFIDQQSYSIMVISMVAMTSIITPIVKYLYKPSKRYIAGKRRTIQHARSDSELRMLACIYREEDTPCIISFLDLSNPTAVSPICFYVVHLMELSGRSVPLIISHQKDKKNSHSTYSDHIINAFRRYEQQNRDVVMVNPLTAISPFATMHEDICGLAVEKRVSMVILPFHKQWIFHGVDESGNAIRAVNRNILKKAPCSLGILIDRGNFRRSTPLISRNAVYRVGVIFLGGADDREALAYAVRIAGQSNVTLTVLRFVDRSMKGKSDHDRELDLNTIKELTVPNIGKERYAYKEEMVMDSVGLVRVIHSVEHSFDLILVGRRHTTDSPLSMGLTEWNEFPELGFIGDMLVSADSNCKASVLVVQQQAFGGEDVLDSLKYHVDDSDSVVEIPRESSRIWPVL